MVMTCVTSGIVMLMGVGPHAKAHRPARTNVNGAWTQTTGRSNAQRIAAGSRMRPRPRRPLRPEDRRQDRARSVAADERGDRGWLAVVGLGRGRGMRIL